MLTKPLARVKFEYFKENIVVLQIEVPSKGSDESVCISDMVIRCVPPMVICKRIAF